MLNNLAPIAIGTYSRLEHLKKTITALQENTLAKYSELYILSDAPKLGDESIVSELRQYTKAVEGFKSVHIIERKENDRINNVRGGLSSLLDQYGKCILLEDDIVTAPGFLEYMNAALNYYEKDSSIVAITGYTPPIKVPRSYIEDSIVLQRFNGWGFGIWKPEFAKINKNIDFRDYEKNISNKAFYNSLRSNGSDIPKMVESVANGTMDALDIKIMYYQIVHSLYIISPRKTLVHNIGHDGTGVHCGLNSKFEEPDMWDKTDDFIFSRELKINNKIKKENYKFWSGSFVKRSLRETVRLLRTVNLKKSIN